MFHYLLPELCRFLGHVFYQIDAYFDLLKVFHSYLQPWVEIAMHPCSLNETNQLSQGKLVIYHCFFWGGWWNRTEVLILFHVFFLNVPKKDSENTSKMAISILGTH